MGKFFDTWNKIYGSKVAKTTRDFLLGKDMDLSDEEYRDKHGYNKPDTSVGIAGMLVAPEWSGVEHLTKGLVGFGGKTPNLGLEALETERAARRSLKAYDMMSKRDAFLKSRIGKVWKELTPSEQYQVTARFGNNWKFQNGGIVKAQGGTKSNWFTRATLNAAMADAPAVMQSMGWQYDKDNNLHQGDWSEEGPTKLRENLSDIATMPLMDMGLGLTGGIISSALSTPYALSAKKRLAEVILRAGDEAAVGNSLLKQILSKNSLKYIFNPKANPNLAYKLPFKYSGETTDIIDAHYGDVVDQFLRKVRPVNEQVVDVKALPENLQNYFSSHYPNMTKVSVSDLGYATSKPSTESINVAKKLAPGEVRTIGGDAPLIEINGKPALDPGGHMQFIKKDAAGNISINGRDIWKFHPDDYLKHNFDTDDFNFIKSIARKGLQFIDNAGEPIIYKWKYLYEPDSAINNVARSTIKK